MIKWVLSANPKFFNHKDAFHQLGFIDWKQTRNFEIGDVVYVYVTKPVSCIQYKTEVIAIEMTENEIENLSQFWLKDQENGSKPLKYMRLKLIEEYDYYKYSYDDLKQHGMKYPPQSPCRVKQELQDYLDGRVRV